MDWKDKVVVVTGAAGGIGRALCRRIHAEQVRGIVVSDLDPSATEACATDVGGLAVPADVSNESDIQSLIRQAEDALGPVDIFISNAGITVKGGVDVLDPDWTRLWNVNVMAHVYASRALLPAMVQRGSGYLINVASAAGVLTEIGSAPYSVTKHGAVALAEWLSVHYQKKGIKVSCVCPAGVATPFLDLSDPIHQFLQMSAVTPEHVAECIIQGVKDEKFLILPHPEVAEFFAFKTQDYDRWLKNFARVHEKIEKKRQKM
ncbi:SDR family oxidoreductase [Planctomyces sp. SH-PL14]|uniref:SDR family oxidoreductase n=1 Tax=Planctomyces sp. SH-PL14 TaxID=1632864 RepID=UPI00078D20FA|nr:SDR family oxidoreductase [Planctomyces sp. SH-PL14]AMV22741.1 putative oxidoreductase [Planctomyces sp. SH-PL14]